MKRACCSRAPPPIPSIRIPVACFQEHAPFPIHQFRARACARSSAAILSWTRACARASNDCLPDNSGLLHPVLATLARHASCPRGTEFARARPQHRSAHLEPARRRADSRPPPYLSALMCTAHYRPFSVPLISFPNLGRGPTCVSHNTADTPSSVNFGS